MIRICYEGAGATWGVDGNVYLPGDSISNLSNWNLSGIIHETIHLIQGRVIARSVYGELEAWQIGLEVRYALESEEPVIGSDHRKIMNIDLSYDPITLLRAEYYMIHSQGLGYPIYLYPLYPNKSFSDFIDTPTGQKIISIGLEILK
ncbi:MAG: hypothetical protein FJZ96_08670 [Chloroflexi bacterium]|nr:hypothetical protein [Chloroflexota bacterium]